MSCVASDVIIRRQKYVYIYRDIPQYSLTVSKEELRHTRKTRLRPLDGISRKRVITNKDAGRFSIGANVCALVLVWVSENNGCAYASGIFLMSACVCVREIEYVWDVSARVQRVLDFWLWQPTENVIYFTHNIHQTQHKSPKLWCSHILSSTIVSITQTQSIHPKYRFFLLSWISTKENE